MNKTIVSATLSLLLAGAAPVFCGDVPAPQPAATPAVAAASAAAPVKVGMMLPTNTMDASADSAALRELMTGYLRGPNVEVLPIEARLPVQAQAEAKVKNCAYLVSATLSQKSTGGHGFAFAKGAMAMSSMVPVVGMAGGMAGMVASTAANAALSSASNLNSAVKAKSEVSLQYNVIDVNTAAPVLSKVAKVKATENGQGVVGSLVTEADTAILNQITQK